VRPVGVIAIGSGVAFAAAMAMLLVFFLTHDERFDRIAEWSFVVFGVLGVITVVATADRTSDSGLAAQVVAAVGLVGIAGTGLGELAATLRLVDFRRIASLLTLAFVLFLAWVGGVSVLALAGGALPAALGWLGLTSIAAGAIVLALIARRPGVITGDAEPPRGLTASFFPPLAGIVAWLVGLGLSLG
jgi:hypothetical protein